MRTFISRIWKNYTQNKLRIYSSSASFYIIVSSVPLVAMLFYIISFLSLELSSGLEGLISSLLPKDIYEGFEDVLVSIKARSSIALVPFSIIAAIWGSTKGIGGICEGIEHIYGVQKAEGFIKRSIQRIWRTLIFYVMTLGSLLIFALGNLLRLNKDCYLPFKILLKLRIFLFAILLFLFFTALYARLSNKKFKSQLLGGAFAAIGWMVFTYFYSIYVSYAINSLSVYAEMGTVIFFMLWVYFCVNIIFIGAEINKK